MTKNSTDILIYTKNPIKHEEFDGIAKQVKNMQGVEHFSQLREKPRLILLIYNRTQTRAINILNKITRLGFEASFVSI